MDKAEEIYDEIIENYGERKYMAKKDNIKLLQQYAEKESRERAIEFTIDFVTEKLQNKPNRHVVINAYDKWKSNQEE